MPLDRTLDLNTELRLRGFNQPKTDNKERSIGIHIKRVISGRTPILHGVVQGLLASAGGLQNEALFLVGFGISIVSMLERESAPQCDPIIGNICPKTLSEKRHVRRRHFFIKCTPPETKHCQNTSKNEPPKRPTCPQIVQNTCNKTPESVNEAWT